MTISVSDPFGVASDPAMPTLALALEPAEAKKELKRRLPRLSGSGRLRLLEIRVIRYKPERRCLLEYDVQVERPELPPEVVTLIGKVRARRFGNESFRLLEDFWKAGFADDAPDGIAVPEPIGVISRFRMWFQRKVPGQTATGLLGGPQGVRLCARVAEAIRKLHATNVPPTRRHGMSEELQVLHDCFAKVRISRPELTSRIDRLAEACERLGNKLPEPQACGIHRDFYPAQVIVYNGRMSLIDFDLYCLGDPALDIGNFAGHMIEHALRELHDPTAFSPQQEALEEKFLELAGPQHRRAVSVYTTLTLARHIYLSTVFPDRQELTSSLLELCEQRAIN